MGKRRKGKRAKVEKNYDPEDFKHVEKKQKGWRR